MQSTPAFNILPFEDSVNTIDMNIPFFEILVLLFVLWPLIQRFLEKNKRNQNPEAGADYPYDGVDDPFSETPRKRKSEQPEWDEAMRELEMIFTGEKSAQPTQREIEQGTQRRANLERSKLEGTDRRAEMQRQSDLGSSRREAMLRQNQSREATGGRLDYKSIEATSGRLDHTSRDATSGRLNQDTHTSRLNRDSRDATSGRLNPEVRNTRRTQLEAMQSRSLKQGRIQPEEMGTAEEMVEQLMESENPIYTSLSVAPEIQSESSEKNFTVYSDIRDPQRLREFFVMKEILDKPVSKRSVRNFV